MAQRIRENWRAEDRAAAQAQRAAAEAEIRRLESVAAQSRQCRAKYCKRLDGKILKILNYFQDYKKL
jgi:hypothetical protein